MEITGRITADAIMKNLSDGRQLVSFDIVVNDYYKSRTGEKKQVATFYDCSYWITTKIAPYLVKGCIVSLYGHLGVYAYKDAGGNPKAALNFHVNNIRFVASPAKTVVKQPETVDDLPF